MRCLRLPLLVAVLLASGLPALGKPAKKQIIVFKDGFIVRGKITRPNTLLHDDKTGHSLSIPVPGGFFYVDDDVRTIAFSPAQTHQVVDDESRNDLVPLRVGAGYTRPDGVLPSRWTIESTSPVDEKLERMLDMNTSAGDFLIKQRLAALTPKTMHFQAHKYTWIMGYYTREWGPDNVKLFVQRGIKKKIKDSQKPMTLFDQRMMVYRFMLQGGWAEHAEKELDDMIQRFPRERKKLEELQASLQKLIAAQFIQGVEQASQVGQHQEAQARLARFYEMKMNRIAPREFLPKLQAVKNRYTAANGKLKDVQRLLPLLPPRTPPEYRDLYAEAVKTLLAELNYDTLPRLETFLGQARAWDRARQAAKAPPATPEQLLAYAISGWLLGDGAAERDPAVGRRLWLARTLVLQSQCEEDPLALRQRAASFEADKKVTVDQVARMIPRLPPPEPHDKLGSDPIELKAGPGGAAYHVQLPPEYNHFRPYPVLLVLHHSAEKAEQELSRWAETAARYGFIVAAPAWAGKAAQGGKIAYQYSPREHTAVLGCLRDLRRRFQIDSDRVFLFGCEEGGKAAYDIGLAHPDQFAGVMPMSASPRYFPFKYWTNAQYLPFYVVNGQFTGQKAKDTRELFKSWIRWGYPSLMIEYKGRASELFNGEVEKIFDWMSRKKRFTPIRELGRKDEEFKTMRLTDSRFYWLSTSAIQARCLNSKLVWNDGTFAATMRAQIFSGNQINVRTFGLGQVTVWLGPGMINYEQKVILNVNSNVLPSRVVTPKLEVLLEDFAHTGDRQRLFWARIDLRV